MSSADHEEGFLFLIFPPSFSLSLLLSSPFLLLSFLSLFPPLFLSEKQMMGLLHFKSNASLTIPKMSLAFFHQWGISLTLNLISFSLSSFFWLASNVFFPFTFSPFSLHFTCKITKFSPFLTQNVFHTLWLLEAVKAYSLISLLPPRGLCQGFSHKMLVPIVR